ncbi:hypothetical protein [Legionella lytica]|jgi:hypothetical protein|nr:hypothetical protein [Legionella lytica]
MGANPEVAPAMKLEHINTNATAFSAWVDPTEFLIKGIEYPFIN